MEGISMFEVEFDEGYGRLNDSFIIKESNNLPGSIGSQSITTLDKHTYHKIAGRSTPTMHVYTCNRLNLTSQHLPSN
jgi:hypothetical protein